MQDLQEVTQEIHYENFRSEKLAGGAPGSARKMRSVSIVLISHQNLIYKFKVYIVLVFLALHYFDMLFGKTIKWNFFKYVLKFFSHLFKV